MALSGNKVAEWLTASLSGFKEGARRELTTGKGGRQRGCVNKTSKRKGEILIKFNTGEENLTAREQTTKTVLTLLIVLLTLIPMHSPENETKLCPDYTWLVVKGITYGD